MALAAALLAACQSPASVRIIPGPDTAIDTPVGLSFAGLRPAAEVTVSARASFLARSWSSAARYRVPASGDLDLARVAPLSGSYSGVDGMGLLWSLRPGPGSAPSVADVARPEQVRVTAHGGGRTLTVLLQRSVGSADVSERALRPGPGQPLYADYLSRPGASDRPGVVIVGGAEGGLDTGLPVAEALAAHGLAVLDLAYFGEPGLPAQLEDIPLEYFATALRWLARQPGVDPRRLSLYGVSRGTEAALLTASYFPGLAAGVVALAPTDSAFCGGTACSTSGWTYQGRPLPFTRQVSNPRPTDVPAALIPVGRFAGRVLLACGGADSRWASCPYARAIGAELRAAGRAAPVVLDYPTAGHGLGFALPYLPELDGPGLAGSSPAANPRARAAEWPRLVAFLEQP